MKGARKFCSATVSLTFLEIVEGVVMLDAFLAIGLVMTAISIPLVFYWKAECIAALLKKYGI